jgi:hypothetical protein
VLQDAGIKLSSVASDLLGKSSRDMLEAMVSGTRDPGVLAELARGRLRAKPPLLQRALEGASAAGMRWSCPRSWALDFLDELITQLSHVGMTD